MDEDLQLKSKQYNIPFYEIEIVLLYNLLVKSQPRMVHLEQQLEIIMKDNPEFRAWDFLFDEKSSAT